MKSRIIEIYALALIWVLVIFFAYLMNGFYGALNSIVGIGLILLLILV